MYSTSSDYSQQINKSLRNTSHLRITIYDLEDNIIFSLDTTSPSDDIFLIDSEWIREIDPLNSKLPVETFKFSFYDYNKLYNPENSLSLWSLIEEKQPIVFEYGYELDNGTIEWIPGSKYVTTGENIWEVEGQLCKVTIESKSIITYLINDAISKGQLLGTYYDILNNALTNCNLTIINQFTWNLNSILNNYTVYGIYENNFKLNEVLQLLAQGACCKLCTGRNGEIIIEPYNPSVLNYTLDFTKINAIPNIKKYPILHSITVNNYVTSASSTDSVIGVFQVYRSEGELIVNFDKPYSNVYVSDWSDRFSYKPTLTIYNLYSVKITGSIKIDYGMAGVQLSGKEVTTDPKPVINKFTVNDLGDSCEIDNPFLTSEPDANRVSDNLTHYLRLRNEYNDIENRGYPEIDPGDIIKAQTLYSNEIEVLIFKNKIKYDGTLSGIISYYLNQEE